MHGGSDMYWRDFLKDATVPTEDLIKEASTKYPSMGGVIPPFRQATLNPKPQTCNLNPEPYI
jgi:hypothetical protein